MIPLRFALPCAALLLASGCITQTRMVTVNVLDKRIDADHPATYNGLPLRSGQLVLTESPDATSYAFFLIPEHYYPFTHIAVLSIEDGEPWVYDVTGEVASIPLKKRLLDNVRGTVFRRKFFEYVSVNLYAEVYDPPRDAKPEAIAAFARRKYDQHIKFDTHFDSKDHSSLYCSEMVSLAIQHAGGTPPALERSNANASITKAMAWLGVPAGEALPAGAFMAPERYVAALGQFPNRTSAWAYFEAKREVFRRFTTDQRLGYVLELRGSGELKVRPHITDFAWDAAKLFEGQPEQPPAGDPRIAQAVRALADKRFGPFPDAAPLAPAADTAPRAIPNATPPAADPAPSQP